MRTALGHGPLAEIRRVRIEIAMKRLADGDEPIASIAHAAGFPSVQAMQAAFQQRLVLTPVAYRRLIRNT